MIQEGNGCIKHYRKIKHDKHFKTNGGLLTKNVRAGRVGIEARLPRMMASMGGKTRKSHRNHTLKWLNCEEREGSKALQRSCCRVEGLI